MQRIARLPCSCLAGLALVGPVPLTAQQLSWALTNARIETVTRGTIERGTVVIRNGLITAVGATVAVPPDAQVLDLSGKTISPALVDLGGAVGLSTAPSSGSAPAAAPRFTGIDPQRAVADEARLTPADAKASRDGAVGALLVAPSRGLYRGQSVLLPALDSASGSQAIRSPVAQHMGYQGLTGSTYPGSLMGVIATQRQMLYDARRYGVIQDRWQADPAGITRPDRDPALEALVPVVRGQLPLFVDAQNENEIRRAARLASEFGVKTVLVGATEAWRATDALKGYGLAVSVNFPRATQATGWRFRGAQRLSPEDSAAADASARQLIEANAAALHSAGFRFALTSGGTRGSEFIANVRKAVAAGLPAATALEAITIRPAELAGVGGALGSVEPGKIANLVVSSGPLLADSSRVLMTFVDGKRFDADPPAPARTSGGSGTAAQLAGNWTITTSSPQGTMESTLNVTPSGSGFTGTMTSQMMGSSPVTDGTVEGRRVSWNTTVQFGGQSFTLTYAGELDGNRMSGTVTAGTFGSFPFTGEKRP